MTTQTLQQNQNQAQTTHTTQSVQPQSVDVQRDETSRPARWTYTPNVDIIENDENIQLVVDIPGVAKDSIDVTLEKGVLSLSARVKPRYQHMRSRIHMCEYGVGDFHRRFAVGDRVDPNNVSAEYNAGVLSIVLPKLQEARPHRITVKTG